jgi:molybdopterin converting factor small subunit
MVVFARLLFLPRRQCDVERGLIPEPSSRPCKLILGGEGRVHARATTSSATMIARARRVGRQIALIAARSPQLLDSVRPLCGAGARHGVRRTEAHGELGIAVPWKEPMDVQVRLGSGLSRLIGRSQFVLDLPPNATVGDLLKFMEDSYPSLASRTERTLTVVGGSQVGPRRRLAEGDQVSLLLPAAGG